MIFKYLAKSNIAREISVTLLVLCLSSCTTKIKDIREKRNEFLNKEVTIEGKVDGNIPLTRYYKVKDEEESIYVKAANELPNDGEKIKVRGKVKEEKIEFAGFRLLNEIYIEEISREY